MPKINTSLKLDKFYQLDLKETKNQISEVDPALSKKQGGIKMAMRKFFANVNGQAWENNIHSVDISTSGAKGGVLFLYENDPDNIPDAKNQPSYVVKLTDAPQRVLFAEYVLKKIGNAKIPKSLVVELDWTDFNTQKTDGMKLVNIILNNNKRHPNVAQDQNKKTKYDDIINNQLNQADPKAAYIIIMKAFVADQMAVVPNDLRAWLTGKGYTKVNLPKEADRTQKFNDLKPQDKQDAGLLKIARAIAKTKQLLNNQDQMKSLGRVLAADTLLGNADRFEAMNVGNAFFITKDYTNPQKKNRIGVIDNDAFLSIYNSEHLHKRIATFHGESPDKSNQESYLQFLLEGGEELLPESEYIDPNGNFAEPQGFNFAPTSSLTQLFKSTNFDSKYFVSNFFGKLLGATGGDADFQLLIDLYKDDGTIIGPGTSYPVFTGKASDSAWQLVKDSIKAGFVEGLNAIQSINLNEYRSVYAHLAILYGFDVNFDFTAFEVRYRYMLEAKLDVSKKTFLDHDAVVTKIKNEYLDKKYTVITEITEALQFGVQEELISANEKDEIISYFTLFDETQQRTCIPQVTGNPNPDYKPRVNAVRCAVLKIIVISLKSNLDKYGSQYTPVHIFCCLFSMFKQIVKELEDNKFYKTTRGLVRKHPNFSGSQSVQNTAQLAGMDLSKY